MVYFLAKSPAPIFNTFDLNRVFGGETGKLLIDSRNRVAALEMIAFSSSVFRIISFKEGYILEVKLENYPTSYSLFVDRRFGDILDFQPPNQLKIRPSRDVIIKRLISALGLPYIWGGNVREGLPIMLEYYPPPRKYNLSQEEENFWTFRGLDCSGLLFEATEGTTPRNTSSLLFYGDSVSIKGKSVKEIAKILKPLDLIVYIGHVIIVLNDDEMIESRISAGGVVKVNSISKLEELVNEEKKIPSDDPSFAIHNSQLFLLRRFFS